MLEKAYSPQKYETDIYKMWEEGGYFRGEINPDKEPFSIAMPPPNATGVLHVGHALGETVQDILARYNRMNGKSVLLLPGTDHAAIASQTLVEKIIAEKEGKSRHDLGREDFLKCVKKYVEDSRTNITKATKRLGISCDWSRERYTMDEGLSKAVNEAFVRLYNEGLIHRGKRIVNWCPRCASGLSDIEVEYKEAPGSLWYIKYPIIKNGSWSLDESILIATTRPETMLGDTAVAVNPKDKRYKKLVGEHVLLPIVEREIPIVADKHVDSNFGTGALKITPAHDMADYEISQRHDLQAINVIGEGGRMTKSAHDFSGMEITEARDAVVGRLQKEGFLERIEEHTHKVPHCERCSTRVEPLISDQWFVKIQPLADKAIKAVKKGDISFASKRFEKTFFQWLKNIHDWNISRQLWWGHRIPVWTCEDCANVVVSADPVKECPKCKHSKLKQDPDTLDTWFSSGLWTFSTLGWPDKTPELDYWHPTTVMEAGRDIIFFWVARMAMLTLHLYGETPFKNVYLNGLVLDKNGQKMSKSKGNVVDLLEVGDKYGMDAVRMSLTVGVTAGLDLKLSETKIENYRNTVNKLWNVARFVFTTTDCKKDCTSIVEIKLDDLALEDRWILGRLNQTIVGVTIAIDKYDFSEAGQLLTGFLWTDFADWYIEVAKINPGPIKNDILMLVLEEFLKLAHPYMPFVTESIWQELKKSAGNTEGESYPDLIAAPWPKAQVQSQKEVKAEQQTWDEFIKLQQLITALRAVHTDYKIPPTTMIPVTIDKYNVGDYKKAIEKLARVKIGELKSKDILRRTVAETILNIDLEGLVDVAKEMERFDKDLKQTEKVLEQLTKRLANKKFLGKAPESVIKKEKERQSALRLKIINLKKTVKELKKIR